MRPRIRRVNGSARHGNTKRKEAIRSGRLLTKQVPGWLKAREDWSGCDPIPDRVKLIQRMYALALKGVGSPTIAKTFNEEGLKGFTGKSWQASFIGLLLSDRRVLGEHQCYADKSKVKPLGDVMLDYFPRIIDEATFNRVQTVKAEHLKRYSSNSYAGSGSYRHDEYLY